MVTLMTPGQGENTSPGNVRDESEKRRSKPCTNRFYLFHLATLIANMFFIGLYASQVYTPHAGCVVDETSITLRYELAFRIGFATMIMEFMILMFVYILP